MDVTQYAQVVVNVSGGGGEDKLAKSLNNTLTSYSSDDVTSLPERAFIKRTNLQTISLPNANSFDSVGYQFDGCSSLTNVNLPKLTLVTTYMFRNCTSLQTFDFTNVINMTNGKIFSGCSSLEGVYAPKATGLGTWDSQAFYNCISLVYARFPINNSVMRQECFSGCTSLKLIDAGVVTNFSNGNNFKNCTSLEVLILRRTSVSPLGNTNNFDGITQTVDVYVPNDTISSYRTASNWSTLYANGIVDFKKLEDSPYEALDFVYMGVPASL